MNTRGKNERGAAAVEYGLIVAAFVVVVLATIHAVGIAATASMNDAAPPCEDGVVQDMCRGRWD